MLQILEIQEVPYVAMALWLYFHKIINHKIQYNLIVLKMQEVQLSMVE
jgi:hypothetical protein